MSDDGRPERARVERLLWRAGLGTPSGRGGGMGRVGLGGPGCEEDNLLVSTEFRSVYATLLEDWMGVQAARVLPGPLPTRLPLVAAA